MPPRTKKVFDLSVLSELKFQRELDERRSIPDREIASEIGVTQQVVSSWRTGKVQHPRNPAPILLLAEYFGVPVETFIKEVPYVPSRQERQIEELLNE
jgi:transcriptional regulator with XRE-family HTH domain